MGSDRHYPEEAPAHRVRGRRLLDRPVHRHQRAVRAIRRRDRPCHAGRDGRPTPADYPGALPEMLVPASTMFKKPAGAGRPAQPLQLVDLCRRGRLAPSARARRARSQGWTTTRSCTSPIEDVEAYAALGRQGGADRSGVGVRRPRRPGRGRVRLGRGVHPGGRQMANTWQGEFPCSNTLRTASSRPRRSAHSRPTATGSTTWPATSGSGPPTGTGAPGGVDEPCCTADNPRGGGREASCEPPAGRHSAQGDQGRLASVRAQLLPALPPRRPHGPADRHLDLASRLPADRACRRRTSGLRLTGRASNPMLLDTQGRWRRCGLFA